MASIPEDELARVKARWSSDDLHRAEYWADLASRDVPWLAGELDAALQVVHAAPTVAHLRELVRWCDLIDKFASMVDESYTLPRDEIQRDLTALADAVERYHARRG
jgi:hypothetical protein